MSKKYIDAEILVKWLENRAEIEIIDPRSRNGYELAAAEIDVIADLLPPSEKLNEDIISSPDDLESLFRKFEEENPYIPTADEQRKNKIFDVIEKLACMFLTGVIIIVLVLLILKSYYDV